jgi:hypothetical protein
MNSLFSSTFFFFFSFLFLSFSIFFYYVPDRRPSDCSGFFDEIKSLYDPFATLAARLLRLLRIEHSGILVRIPNG